MRKVLKNVYKRLYSAFVEKELPPNYSQCRDLEKDPLKLLRVVLCGNGYIDRESEKRI